MMKALDTLEAVPVHYHKIHIPVEVLSPGEPGSSIQEIPAYIVKDFKPELLHQKFFDNYDSYGDHGKHYLLPKDRDPNSPWPFSEIKIIYSEPLKFEDKVQAG